MSTLIARLCLAACLGASFAASAASADSDAAQRFRAIYTQEWDWRQQQFAGADDEDTQALPADHLPRVDAATQAMRERYWADVLERLDAIPADALHGDERVSYEVYRNQVEALLADQRFRTWQMPFNSDTSFWGNLGFTARRPLRNAADYRRYIGLLRDVPRYFDEQIANMRAGLARGFSVPRATLAGRDQSIANVARAKDADSLFYEPFRQMPASIPAGQQALLRADGLAAIRDAVAPAHARLLDFIRNVYMKQARDSLAAEAMPDGKAFYRAQIRKFTTLDMSPDAIHALGLKEVARLHADMERTIGETGFKGSFAAFLHYLRTDPKFYPRSADELLKQAAWIANRVNGKLGQYVGRLPRQRFVIEPVPAELAPFYTGGRGGAGYYMVNTYDLPSRPLYALTALTLHESAPGHALQMPLAAEHEGLPDFRRNTYISAFGEGWALYSERLGLEMGLYDTPYDRFGYLGYQMWRACRLVVDTGIHHLGWSRAQAIAYMRENTALGEHEIETEVDRYIAWPGQALAYYLGEMAIVQARERAEKALGERFDLRAFHDAVLALGSVPLPVLQQQIDRFIADGGKSPYDEKR
ncbi:hypothetical protein ASG87_07110 [Frateuria sp. Soil773]|uniref:DUF885 domain-containing protein n=1 Tax=Frateuria sp. Soil773 TaxID=1736407 RepID=UPI0006F4D3EB|nr:DUF885 family protein [Frateuria sp. Soil773]KRE88375.1 hypothetical protein ASG87_07110 [Frateuria sp. Soil773]